MWLLIAAFLGTATACAPTSEHRGTGEVVDDATLTARVKTALVKTDGVDALSINVNTYRGVVQLAGFVKDAEETRRAVEAARKVPGVVKVENSLKIAPKR
jgi:hyperosmotically inducible protein